MERLWIQGEQKLYGNVKCSGMKNSAIPILFATILTQDICVIENVPSISDVFTTIDILEKMGAKIKKEQNETLVVDTTHLKSFTKCDHLIKKMRASYYLLGAGIETFRYINIPYPGGCDFGGRPIDQHIKVLAAMGINCSLTDDSITVQCLNPLKGATLKFDVVSVGATIQALLVATKANGITILENVAKEPHVQDVARFLNCCGAKIEGTGTEKIKITGTKRIHGCRYRISDDMIEAGTYLIATAACGGEIRMELDVPFFQRPLVSVLKKMGAEIEEEKTAIWIKREKELKTINVKTAPFPGFPTDLQPQLGALMATIKGRSSLSEKVWAHRFRYLSELKKMGANFAIFEDTVFFEGGALKGTSVHAHDLRAGAALLIAGLSAKGITELSGLEYIERGYANLVQKFNALGAQLKKIE